MDLTSEPYPRFPCRVPYWLSANGDALRRSTWTNFHIFIALIWNFSSIHLYGLQFLISFNQNSHGIFGEFSSPDFLISFCWIWQECKAWNLLSFTLWQPNCHCYPHEAPMCKSLAFYKGGWWQVPSTQSVMSFIVKQILLQWKVTSYLLRGGVLCPSLWSKSCFKETLLPHL
jgi:hypothetical protein